MQQKTASLVLRVAGGSGIQTLSLTDASDRGPIPDFWGMVAGPA